MHIFLKESINCDVHSVDEDFRIALFPGLEKSQIKVNNKHCLRGPSKLGFLPLIPLYPITWNQRISGRETWEEEYVDWNGSYDKITGSWRQDQPRISKWNEKVKKKVVPCTCCSSKCKHSFRFRFFFTLYKFKLANFLDWKAVRLL